MQPIIKILVGASKAQYFAHRSVLVDTSDFFRAALEGPWEESKGVVELQEERSETFETYLQYAYCSKIFVRKDGDISITSGEWGPLVNLYILADFLKAEALKNDIIDGFIELWKETGRYPVGLAKRIYRSTAEISPLRRFYVDLVVWVGKCAVPNRNDLNDYDGPKEFFRDIARACKAGGAKIWTVCRDEYPWVKDRCSYHEHADGVKCKE